MTLKKNRLPFGKLLEGLTAEHAYPDQMVTGVTADSRRVKPGYIFVALKGEKQDGSAFVPAALAAGAVAILCDMEASITVPSGVILIHHKNPRYLFSRIAARFYASQPRVMVGVTGTNGKTSVAYFYAQICHLLGYQSAALGTIGILSGDGSPLPIPHEGLTTPEPEQLHASLAALAELGITHAAMEASSHGLSQYRLHGVELTAAAFTNLSHDHLDYHGTEAAYFDSKMMLFSEILPKGATAVINADSVMAPQVMARCEARGDMICSFGENGVNIKVKNIKQSIDKQTITVEYPGGCDTIDIPLVGSFQVSNVLCALGLVAASGIELKKAIAVLPSLKGVPGRMEKVPGNMGSPAVIVDYAHTPDGLEKALQELKILTRGKLWVVFGCGGDRDKTKRPKMGTIAAALADKVVVTDDNPRTENAGHIRRAIMEGCPEATEIADRKDAIAFAVSQATEGDTVLIAGKGHEKYQLTGTQKMPFDDVRTAEEMIQKMSA